MSQIRIAPPPFSISDDARRLQPVPTVGQPGEVVGLRQPLQLGDALGQAAGLAALVGLRDLVGEDVEDVGGQAQPIERDLEQRVVGLDAVRASRRRCWPAARRRSSAFGAPTPVGPPWCQAMIDATSAGRPQRSASSAPHWAWSMPKRSRSARTRSAPAGELARQGVAGLLAEDLGQDELADVVQQAREVDGVARDARLLGRRGGADGDRDRVQVQLAARGAAVALGALQEAEGRGLQREAAQRAAADEHHGLADRLGPDRMRARRRVREAQEVRGEGRVLLQGVDQVGRRGVLVIAERDDPEHRGVQDRELGQFVNGACDGSGSDGVDAFLPGRAVRCVLCLHGSLWASAGTGLALRWGCGRWTSVGDASIGRVPAPGRVRSATRTPDWGFPPFPPGARRRQGERRNARPRSPRTPPVTKTQRWTLAVVCAATAMLMLDIAVVNTALSEIAGDLDTGLARPAVGRRRLHARARLDRAHRRRRWPTASAAAACSPSAWRCSPSPRCSAPPATDIAVLNAARAVQGVGARDHVRRLARAAGQRLPDRARSAPARWPPTARRSAPRSPSARSSAAR